MFPPAHGPTYLEASVNTSIILGHTDEALQLKPETVLALINLHSLLYQQPLIPDSFLITGLFQTVDQVSPKGSFSELFRNGFLGVAFREGDAKTLTQLMEELRLKTRKGTFIPLEGTKKGEELFVSVLFRRYLDRIDDAISGSNCVRWSPSLLGTTYREEMRKSAQDGTSGLPPEVAVGAFEAADRLAEAEAKSEGKGSEQPTHTRSMYCTVADQMEYKPLASQIKAWATVKYLRNLPDAYGLSLSLPRSAITDVKAWDPFELLEMIPDETKATHLQDINSVIFNPAFLLNLDPDSVGTFRSYAEFKTLQGALAENDPATVLPALASYLMRISSDAPKHYAPWMNRIANLELQRKAKVGLVATARLVGAYLFAPIPLLGAALWLLSFYLASLKDTEKLISDAQKEAKLELSLRFRTSTEALSDLCHQIRAPAEPLKSSHG